MLRRPLPTQETVPLNFCVNPRWGEPRQVLKDSARRTGKEDITCGLSGPNVERELVQSGGIHDSGWVVMDSVEAVAHAS